TKFFTPQELKVFDKLPADERTSHIHDTFVTPTPINDLQQLRLTLLTKTFGAWPARSEIHPSSENVSKNNGRELRYLEFDSEPNVRLKFLYLPKDSGREVRLHLLTKDQLPFLATAFR